jgi:hypothetical protein
MQMVKFKSKGLWGKGKKAFLRRKNKYTKIIDEIFDANRPSYIWSSIDERSVSPKMKSYYKSLGW